MNVPLSLADFGNWSRKMLLSSCMRQRFKHFKTWIRERLRMLVAKPGEVWQTDLGMQAKVRPCLVLTSPPKDDELAVATVVAHTTALRGNSWEIKIPKYFLDSGAFDVQRIATVATVKLER